MILNDVPDDSVLRKNTRKSILSVMRRKTNSFNGNKVTTKITRIDRNILHVLQFQNPL
ncbi:hypothetical protein HanRHA438_Chr15g0698031 [Helianthus annuus]|nr:hypothetical protein HanRHA438_Chr15g0698031 [Helianthus annuus]